MLKDLNLVVRVEGLEPRLAAQNLNLVRLPISPHPLRKYFLYSASLPKDYQVSSAKIHF